MEGTLPLLSEMRLAALSSIWRGKKIKPSGINFQHNYNKVCIDKKLLASYARFTGFAQQNPLLFLYILAQRAQLASMLSSEFTIPIPGLVHAENQLEQINPFDFDEAFDIETSVEVPYKKEGSLPIQFDVRFLQKGNCVALCKSVYIAVRKQRKSKKKKSVYSESTINAHHTMEFDFPAKLGREYAKASGDHNPIHTQYLFAKLAGFKRPILHGWCTISMLAKEIEEWAGSTVIAVNTKFKAPVYLPSSQKLIIDRMEKKACNFQLIDKASQKINVEGIFSFC